MIQPDALTITNIAALVSVAGIGIRLLRAVIKVEVKTDLLWERVFGADKD